MSVRKRSEDMSDKATVVGRSILFAVPDKDAYVENDSKEKCEAGWLKWLWKWFLIYLHNINVRTMPERPQNRWATIISIITLGSVLLTMWWNVSDRDGKRVKEISAASYEAGQRNTMEVERDKKLANQAADIEKMKQTLGLLPPTPKKEKDK
jgi:hypothetical protein